MSTECWQCVSTAVTAFATAVLAVLTGWYVWLTRRQAKLLQDQTNIMLRQDKERVKRALLAMTTEATANEELIKADKACILLCGAFDANSWALTELPILPGTVNALAQANVAVRRLNMAIEGDEIGAGSRTTQSSTAWANAKAPVQRAAQAVREDKQYRELLASGLPSA